MYLPFKPLEMAKLGLIIPNIINHIENPPMPFSTNKISKLSIWQDVA
jgi:hypothetical protein